MYDLIIIGGSAASTAAGIYAARRGLKFKIITKEFGGEVATSGEVGNWPGMGQTDGFTIAQKFKEHLQFYKADIEEGVWVEKVTKQEDGTFCITAKTGKESKSAGDRMIEETNGAPKCDYEAKAVIIATGVHPRELGVPGEKEFRNKGVTYCTTCDGPLFQGKVVATVGGGNSALESALMLADIASKVYVVNKNAQFKGEKVLVDKLQAKENVEIIYEAMTTEVVGDQLVKALKYKDKEGKEQQLDVEGVFVHIGMIPNSGLVGDEVKKDQLGQIEIDANMQTNVPGLYAAGDVTTVAFNQIVIAAGQGCIATLSAVQYLNSLTS